MLLGKFLQTRSEGKSGRITKQVDIAITYIRTVLNVRQATDGKCRFTSVSLYEHRNDRQFHPESKTVAGTSRKHSLSVILLQL
jgi:hypothetical protein